MVRVQFQCRTPQSARTSWNGSGGHVLPGLDPVVREKLDPINTETYHLAQGFDSQANRPQAPALGQNLMRGHHDGQLGKHTFFRAPS